MFKSQQISPATQLYRSGKPFATDAVVAPIPKDRFEEAALPEWFTIERMADGSVKLLYTMAPEDQIYGLGQNMGPFNRRGRRYELFAIDDNHHMPHKEALYGSHPFLIVDGPHTFGLLIDFPGRIIFDIGFTDRHILEIVIPRADFDLYLFDETNKLEIIRQCLLLTGTPYVPPRWAFGYMQCRWSYPDEAAVREVADGFRENDIPCDAIFMDIDYMEAFKVFTISEERFPRFPEFIREMQGRGFRLVPIIDPGVKIEKGYRVYDEGHEKGYFCTGKDGKEFVVAVWPGLTHLPDFLNPEARQWWADQYKELIRMGIPGFWNDMNEPSLFYTPEAAYHLLATLKRSSIRKLRSLNVNDFLGQVFGLSQNPEYYKDFYHRLADGTRVRNDEVHNLYGFNMTRATAEAFRQVDPDRRYFLLSRSSATGLHRYATIWMGDNDSWWEHMLTQIRMTMALNMSGYFYTGADIGGFASNVSPELLIRWTQLGAFSPMCRNHSAKGTRRQEPWAFGPDDTRIMRDAIRLRYAFLPYSYSEFIRSVETLTPFVTPLCFLFDDPRAGNVEDQFMVGQSLMVAPVIHSNASGRYVHLPQGLWLHWNAARHDHRTMKVMEPGDYFIKADLSKIPLFIRENRLIALTEPVAHLGLYHPKKIILTGLVTDWAFFTIHEDDGETYGFRNGKRSRLTVTVRKTQSGYEVACELDEHPSVPFSTESVHLEIYDSQGEMTVIEKSVR